MEKGRGLKYEENVLLAMKLNMTNILLVIVLIVVVVGALEEESRGAERALGMLNPRVIGGKDADLKEATFMVALIRNGHFDCGGSILNELFVLTAAHCIKSKSDNYTARVGSIYWYDGGVTHDIVSMIAHPKYNIDQPKNHDVGIMKVSPKFEFSSLVQPVVLAEKGVEIPETQKAVVYGWGVMHVDPFTFPTQLQTVELDTISNQECSKVFPGEIQNEMLCAGNKHARKDACFGDSGGPLLIGDIQYGIVSWGPDGTCAKNEQPYGVYVNVPQLRDWIDEHSR